MSLKFSACDACALLWGAALVLQLSALQAQVGALEEMTQQLHQQQQLAADGANMQTQQAGMLQVVMQGGWSLGVVCHGVLGYSYVPACCPVRHPDLNSCCTLHGSAAQSHTHILLPHLLLKG